MSLQNKIISRYRLFYPNQTLREVSGTTGIQITRVFRLFNGKPMKVKELEAFEKVIAGKLSENPNFSRLTHVVDEASALLTNDEIGRIADYLERKVSNRRFSRTYIRPLFEDASIA